MPALRARSENARIRHKPALEIEKFFTAVGTFQLFEGCDLMPLNTPFKNYFNRYKEEW